MQGISPKKKQLLREAALTQKIVEVKIREHNQQYQQLLIQTKELELKILQQRQQFNSLMRSHRKKRKSVREVEQEFEVYHSQNQHKKKYLRDFYAHLKEKYTAANPGFSLEIQRLEAVLRDKYSEEEQHMQRFYKESQAELLTVQEELKSLTAKKNEMELKCEGIEDIGSPKHSLKKISDENTELELSLKEALTLKKKYESEEKVLKKLSNIEEEHKKCSLVITNGIRRLFAIALKEKMYQEAVNGHYLKSLPGIKQILEKRRGEKERLQQQLKEKRGKLNKLKEEMSFRANQYRQLEDSFMALSQLKKGKQPGSR